MDEKRLELREFLKDKIRKEVDGTKTAQTLGVPMPPITKPIPAGTKLIPLPDWRDDVAEQNVPFSTLVAGRKSIRKYGERALTLGELSYLCWATQGVRRDRGDGSVWRNVPSAGNRHALETYIAVLHVQGLEPGIYLYRPQEHALAFCHQNDNYVNDLNEGVRRQIFVAKAPVTFIWTAIPWRMEWRYSVASVKVIALDAGHVCQNLYMAAQSIDLGVCAIAAYDQKIMDDFIKVDGVDEFTVYLASVGHLNT